MSIAALLAVGVSGAATAHQTVTTGDSTLTNRLTLLRTGSSGPVVAALQRALGIPADGIFGPATRRAVIAFQRANGLQVDGVAGPVTLGALKVAPVSRSAPATTNPPPAARSIGSQAAVLARIAACESGGDPTAVSSDGRYRGKYQFRRATWRALGGSGDPAAAPEAEQDRIAALLLAREGTRPWPTCGRGIG